MVRTCKSLLNLPENLIFSNETTYEFERDIYAIVRVSARYSQFNKDSANDCI